MLVPPLLVALTLHELAHGLVAYKLGDPTAKNQGRLTLNPLKHLDPIGTIAFFLIKFGWAKPVPVVPQYFRNPKQGMLFVALAGPLTNLMLALLSVLILKSILPFALVLTQNETVKMITLVIGLMLVHSVWINLVLCIFNFLPIPPLDGSRILAGLLPNKLSHSYLKLEKFGFILVLALALSGTLSKIILPLIEYANNLLLS